MPQGTHLPDQPIMKYVHPADRLRPWFGVAVGLAALDSGEQAPLHPLAGATITTPGSKLAPATSEIPTPEVRC